MDIQFKYVPEKNPAGVYFEGVPLADISAERFARYRPDVQEQIKQCGFYEEVVPPAKPKNKPAKEGE
jgi:hypothetical protein